MFFSSLSHRRGCGSGFGTVALKRPGRSEPVTTKPYTLVTIRIKQDDGQSVGIFLFEVPTAILGFRQIDVRLHKGRQTVRCGQFPGRARFPSAMDPQPLLRIGPNGALDRGVDARQDFAGGFF